MNTEPVELLSPMQIDCAQLESDRERIIDECLSLVFPSSPTLDPARKRRVEKELNELVRAQPKQPLVNKTVNEKRLVTNHWVALRNPYINTTLYRRMVNAVEKHFNAPKKHPLILYVRDLSRYDQQDYSLLYKPRCTPDAINVLQTLHTLEIEERSRFITMLEQEPSLIERWSNLDSLPSMCYTQICEVVVPASLRK